MEEFKSEIDLKEHMQSRHSSCSKDATMCVNCPKEQECDAFIKYVVDNLPPNYDDYPEVNDAELDEWIAKAAKE